ncbi:MAG: glycosyltransferase [Pseudomonadota bacterium]|nr:glycosyltransferase [Pseudomonadota bacterium]
MPDRLKLNIFSPLPPLRTEIANHTTYVLPWLGRMADVTVWTAQAEWSGIATDCVQVRRYQVENPPWDEFNHAAASFFNLGNNLTFHKEVFQIARVMPGIAILHDTVMQHFFAGLAVDHGWQREYLIAMRRHHGSDGDRNAQRFLAGETGIDELAQRYPLSLAAAERSVAVICHNIDAAEAMMGSTRVPVYHHELSLDISAIAEPSDRRFVPPYRIVVFGFLGSNRRLPSLLQALAELPERHSFRLDIYGEVEDGEGVRRLIAALGLGSLVAMHGFVDTLTLDRGIAAAHLAINLRYPSMGEASGSQLRIWAHALPSLVTRTGWYATLPTEAVFFVDPDDEVEGIKRHLVRFLASPATYEAAGRCGRRTVATRHSPQRYAEALIEIAGHAPVQHRCRAAIDLARVSSRMLRSMADVEAVEHAAPGVAREIALMCQPATAGRNASMRADELTGQAGITPKQ